MSDELKGILIATLLACLIWELDERQHKKKKMNKGYTLIEILVVILLIGIMSAIAIPRFEKRIELEELKHEKEFTR